MYVKVKDKVAHAQAPHYEGIREHEGKIPCNGDFGTRGK